MFRQETADESGRGQASSRAPVGRPAAAAAWGRPPGRVCGGMNWLAWHPYHTGRIQHALPLRGQSV